MDGFSWRRCAPELAVVAAGLAIRLGPGRRSAGRGRMAAGVRDGGGCLLDGLRLAHRLSPGWGVCEMCAMWWPWWATRTPSSSETRGLDARARARLTSGLSSFSPTVATTDAFCTGSSLSDSSRGLCASCGARVACRHQSCVHCPRCGRLPLTVALSVLRQTFRRPRMFLSRTSSSSSRSATPSTHHGRNGNRPSVRIPVPRCISST